MGLNSHTRPRLWSQNPNPCICPLVTLCVCVCLSLSWLSRSSSYTRRFNSQSGNDLTSSTPSLLHRSVMLLTARLTLLFVCNCHCPLTANANLCAAVKGAFEFPMGSVLFPAHLMERDWMTPPWPQLAQERALLDSAALIVSWLRGIFHFTLHVQFFLFFFFPLDQYESPFIFLSTKRLPQEQTEKKDQPAITTSNSQSTTAGEQEAKQRRKWVISVSLRMSKGATLLLNLRFG